MEVGGWDACYAILIPYINLAGGIIQPVIYTVKGEVSSF